MANVIRLKRASGSDPAASDLVSGEPAVRTDTGELFFKKDDGSIAKVAGAGGGPDFKYLALRNAANNGAASFPNADFTLVTSGTTSAITPTAANTLLVSVNGVIQKPNTGTSTPSQGFALSGSTIKFGANISAAPDFILYQESGGIGEPSDDTVSEVKLKVSNSPINGYFLSAQSGNNGGLTWAAPVATSCTGNSATATALATARTINGTSFDGTANITVTAAAGTLTGNTLNSSVVTSSLTSLGDLAGLTVNGNSVFTGDVIFDGATAGRDIVFDRSDNALEFADSAVASFGASSDFRIFHNGSDSILQDQGTGSLIALSNRFHIKNAANNESLAQFIENGAVELYHNNIKMLETADVGVRVGDDKRYVVGDDNDGYLRYTSNTVEIYVAHAQPFKINLGSETALLATANGSVDLYHNNSKKFETSSSGVIVSGDIVLGDNKTIRLGDGSNGDFRMLHGGTNTTLRNLTGQLQLRSDTIVFENNDGSDFATVTGIKFGDNNKARFGNGNDLQIYHDSSATANIILANSGSINIRMNSSENAIVARQNGAVELYHDNNKKFETTSNGVQLGGLLATEGNNISFGDGSSGNGALNRLTMGASNDLQIYHDGSHSRIENSTGALIIQAASNNEIQLNGNGQHAAKFNPTGTSYIYHNGNLRFSIAATNTVHHEDFVPSSNNAFDLGQTSYRWRNIYTNDLNLSNEGGSNEVDGTWGSYTIQEGAEDLFLINKRSGKKYKFNLTEVS